MSLVRNYCPITELEEVGKTDDGETLYKVDGEEITQQEYCDKHCNLLSC